MNASQRGYATTLMLAAGLLWGEVVSAQDVSGEPGVARVAVVSPDVEPLEMGRPLETSGDSSRAELVEQLQLLEWDRQQPPRFASGSSLPERAFGVFFRAVSGGGGASKDLARINPDLPE